MFERFTKDARRVVQAAVGQAERAGDSTVREDHLLLALLDDGGARGTAALTALGVTGRRASIERALADAQRRGGLSLSDTEALAGLGIDVAEVVQRVEEVHGEGALAGCGKPGRPWPFGVGSAHRPFTPGSKQLLARTLRIAVGRGDKTIDSEHLLLALAGQPGVVSDVLAEHGATTAEITRVLAPVSGKATG
ncbi:Clp protease N-terminal domain-containing protein [Streptomyces sp. H27-D2]|uniref:Clp protease N-terminal domain-containing protein n=1 Tax=Streptomyces sp. H27-D2 TaxID=3046304 RepID=UPI002DB931EC|nr:Clp protease N-terminal domain-containing protein [Streptomyces sp. H27-D2]MEC4018173.1 Clp protease N-terminal domain-containing protein [Streptomyces sp. H27-D2]